MRRLFATGAVALLGCAGGRQRWVDTLPPDVREQAAAPSASALVMSPPPPVPAELLQDGKGLDAFANAKRKGALQPARDAPKVLRRALERTLTGEVDGGRSELLSAELAEAEGEVASTRLTLAAGACLTVGAHGGVGVLETDVFVTRAGKRSELLGEDTTRGPGAVVGGRAGCLRNGGSGPLEVEVWVLARTGGGLLLVRVAISAAP